MNYLYNDYIIESCSTSPKIYSGSPTPIQVFNDEIKYLCFHGFDHYTAQVVCRENAQVDAVNFFGTNSTFLTTQYPIANFAYNCNGTEASLCDCTQTPQTCLNDLVVAVQCNLPGNYIMILCLRFSHNTYIFLSYTKRIRMCIVWVRSNVT